MKFYFLGNGPSAITLSYLLSGHVPYYRGNSNDEFLHLRLSENSDQPLVLQDLEFLSDVSIFLKQVNIYNYGNTGCGVFKRERYKFRKVFAKNQHILTQRKLLNFAYWSNGEVSKSAKIWLSKSILCVKLDT